jgi:hypothetical protein
VKDAILVIDTGTGERRVRLSDYLDGERIEEAAVSANAWIKQLRHASVDGQPFRRRFSVRGDSLWWFAELYLHKTQAIARLLRTILALEHLIQREEPLALGVDGGDAGLRLVAPQVTRARGVRYQGPEPSVRVPWHRIARMDVRARGLALAARASRLKRRRGRTAERARLAAFVHRAFWAPDGDEGSAESYIGPVLAAIERRLPPGAVRYVGVGPSANFAARRWWDPLRSSVADRAVTPVEGFAPLSALADSRRVWRSRHPWRRALWSSVDLRQHAVIRGCDCWPVVGEELAGVALLQWPWSVRAMDEAAAALDALRPAATLTYAEAGGWGRALMLESRRRGIPSIALQHGFIYRHWLNYLHEPDEMAPDPVRPTDAGFPRPTITLLYDDYAAQHLEQAGCFDRGALAVTGSPRLDGLVKAAAGMTPAQQQEAREAAGAAVSEEVVLVVTKYREARELLGAVVEGAGAVPRVRLAIKTHPAETPAVYAAVAAGRPHVRVLPASAPLAPLLRASRAVVTVNSTVALDAAVLDIPALVVGLPNNLSPFVDAGMMAGGNTAGEIAAALQRILYDEQFRQQLARDRKALLTRFHIGSDGHAAERAADVVLRVLGGKGL